MEQIEKRYDAQLVYSFDMALQNEFSLEENIQLARDQRPFQSLCKLKKLK